MPRQKNTGARTRFNGFSLTEVKRDRVVAEWINAQPNAAEAIKALIYAVATGAGIPGRREISVVTDDEPITLDPADPRVVALASAIDT